MHAASCNHHELSDAKTAAIVYVVVLSDLIISVDNDTFLLLLPTPRDVTHLIDVEVGSLRRYLTPVGNALMDEVARS